MLTAYKVVIVIAVAAFAWQVYCYFKNNKEVL